MTEIVKEKKQTGPLVILVIILAVLGALMLSCQVILPLLTAATAPQPTTRAVLYKITGDASDASLTYANATGDTEQAAVPVPWQKSLTVPRGQFVYLSAQNQNESGAITCEIWANGSKYKSATTTSAYGIASCSGSAN